MAAPARVKGKIRDPVGLDPLLQVLPNSEGVILMRACLKTRNAQAVAAVFCSSVSEN